MPRKKKFAIMTQGERAKKRRQLKSCENMLRELESKINIEKRRVFPYKSSEKTLNEATMSCLSGGKFDFECEVINICNTGVMSVIKENRPLWHEFSKIDAKLLPLPLVEVNTDAINAETSAPATSDDSDDFANLESPETRRKNYSRRRYYERMAAKVENPLEAFRPFKDMNKDVDDSWSEHSSNDLVDGDEYNELYRREVTTNGQSAEKKANDILNGDHCGANGNFFDEDMDGDVIVDVEGEDEIMRPEFKIDELADQLDALSIRPDDSSVTSKSPSTESSEDGSHGDCATTAEQEKEKAHGFFAGFSHRNMPYDEILKFVIFQKGLKTAQEKDDALQTFVLAMAAKHMLKETQADFFWNVVRAVIQVYDPSRKPKCYKTIRKKWEQVLPRKYMSYVLRDKLTGEIHHVTSQRYPKRNFPKRKFECLSEWTSTDIEEAWKFHCKTHKKDPGLSPYHVKYDMAVDGVPLSKSGIDQMTLACLRFEGCENVYLAGVHVFRKNTKKDLRQKLRVWLIDAQSKAFQLRVLIADSPMRAFLKNLKGHAGHFSCDRCFAPGKLIRRGKLVFPYVSVNYKHRTHADWVKICERRKNAWRELSHDQCMGITGESPFLVLNNFDMVNQIPIEPMHNLYLCLTKAIISLILDKSEKKAKIIKLFDVQWEKLSIPSDFNRRPRSMEFNMAHFKSGEYASIIICAPFMFARSVIGNGCASLKKAWLIFAYLVRAALLNNEQYKELLENVPITELHKIFYALFQEVFGEENCTFTLHEFFHLRETRKMFTLSEISAEPFEAFFSFIKAVIANNTISFAKQIIDKSFMANIGDHCCEPKINVKIGDRRANTRDDYIYTRDRQFYQVIEQSGDSYICRKIITSKYQREDLPFLNYELIGIAVREEVTAQTYLIKANDVTGKAVLDGSIILSISVDALRS